MSHDQDRTRVLRRVAALSGASAVLVGGTLGLAGVASAAFPNANGLIAFTSTRDSNTAQNLFIVNPAQANGSASSDQAAVQPLTNTTSDDDGAFFSPDGTKVVFFSDRNGSSQIWTVATSNKPTTGDTTGASPAADGASLYFPDANHDDYWPSYAPDGHTIAFNQDDVSIIVVDPTAASPTEVNVTEPGTEPANLGRPVFDPKDQSKLVYADSSHHFIEVSGIGTANLTYTDVSAASGIGAQAADEYPDWSPDGTGLVFDSTRGLSGTGTSSLHQIWTVKLATDAAAPYFTNGSGAAASTGYSDQEPAYSPDGTRVTFSRTMNGKDVDASASGSETHSLSSSVTDLSLTTSSSPVDIDPDWEGTTATPPSSVPESPWSAGLPIAGAAMIGGSYLLLRRRPSKA